MNGRDTHRPGLPAPGPSPEAEGGVVSLASRGIGGHQGTSRLAGRVTCVGSPAAAAKTQPGRLRAQRRPPRGPGLPGRPPDGRREQPGPPAPVPSRPPAPSALRVFPSVSDALLYKDDRRGSLGRTPRTSLPGGRPIKGHVSKRGRVERGQGRGLHRRRDRRDCSGVTNQDTRGHGTRVLMKNAIARQPRARRACNVGQPRAASRDSGPGGAACQASEATRRHPWLEAVEGGVRNATGGPRMAR